MLAHLGTTEVRLEVERVRKLQVMSALIKSKKVRVLKGQLLLMGALDTSEG